MTPFNTTVEGDAGDEEAGGGIDEGDGITGAVVSVDG